MMNLANLGMDGAALVKELLRSDRDPANLFLLCASAGVDVAGLFPGLNSLTTPLATAIAMMQLLGGPGLIGNPQDFDHELADLREPRPQLEKAA